MTLNCGVGMVALVAADAADRAVAVLAEHDVRAWVAGEVGRRDDPAGTRRRWWARIPVGDRSRRRRQRFLGPYVQEQPRTR